MGNVNNVTSASGEFFWAPVGTTLPTDAESELAAAFKSLGFCSEDGMKENATRSSESTKEWGGKVVMNNQNEYTETYAVTFIEADNIEVKKAVYGDDNVDENGHVTTDGSDLPNKTYVINLVGRGGSKRRIVIPNGQITEVGEVSYVKNAPISYAATISAYPDTNGKCSYRY